MGTWISENMVLAQKYFECLEQPNRYNPLFLAEALMFLERMATRPNSFSCSDTALNRKMTLGQFAAAFGYEKRWIQEQKAAILPLAIQELMKEAMEGPVYENVYPVGGQVKSGGYVYVGRIASYLWYARELAKLLGKDLTELGYDKTAQDNVTLRHMAAVIISTVENALAFCTESCIHVYSFRKELGEIERFLEKEPYKELAETLNIPEIIGPDRTSRIRDALKFCNDRGLSALFGKKKPQSPENLVP